MLYFGMQYGYFGVLVISLAGALLILFPVPDSLVVFTISGLKIGGRWAFEPVLIAAAAGVGAAIGELSGYLVGFSGRKAIAERYKKKVNFLAKIFNKFGSVAIFIFALTPLPDDLVFIPLGIMHYNLVKAFVPVLIGKLIMSLIVAYAGRFSIGIIRDTFGVGGEPISALIVFAAGIALMIIMFKVDWEKYLEKYLFKKSDGT